MASITRLRVEKIASVSRFFVFLFLIGCGCLKRSSLQAVSLLLDSVQSRPGLKDSRRYPKLTRCHCEGPVITISSPHETFMARWQRVSGKNPHFQRKAWQNLGLCCHGHDC